MKTFVAILIVSTIVMSCGEPINAEVIETETPELRLLKDYSEEELVTLSNEIEADLLDTAKLDSFKGNSVKILDLSQVFLIKYPESEHLRSIIKKGYQSAKGLGQSKEAIRLIDLAISKFGSDSTIVEEMIYKATILDNENDKKNAEIAYKAIVEKFPNHIFGKNSAERLKTIHLTDAELMEHFAKINVE